MLNVDVVKYNVAMQRVFRLKLPSLLINVKAFIKVGDDAGEWLKPLAKLE